jgi:hypothetical protein
MYYQLPSGRTIEITVEQYLDMTDEDIEYLIAYNHGNIIEQPFHGSSLTSKLSSHTDDDLDITPEIPDIDSEDKLEDLDMDLFVET